MSVTDEVAEIVGKHKKADILELAERLEDSYLFVCMRDNEDLCYYNENEGIYELGAEVIIKSQLQKYQPRITKNDVIEVITKIKQRNLTGRREEFIGALDGDRWLHVKNGWLNMDTLELEPHTPERRSLYKINATYDKDARAVEFGKMTGRAAKPEDVLELFKIMGNVLTPDNRYEKVTLLVGDGHNRKSSTLLAIENTIGGHLTAHVSAQEIAGDRFAPAQLYNKMLNTVGDLSADPIARTGRFKELASSDPIMAQRKYGQPFTFVNHAKTIYSANDIPPSNDQTNAYFRRWAILTYTRHFEKDPTLYKRLTTESEKSGILNIMLHGRKLLKKYGFRETPIEKIRALYNLGASIYKTFLAEECVIDITKGKEHSVATRRLQEAAKEHWIKNGRPAKDFSIEELGEALTKSGIEKHKIQRDGTREPYYIGIMLKTDVTLSQSLLG